MLVLSRRIGEEIVIAGDIRVTVVAVKGPQVRLGITAPSSVPVARLELLAGDSKGATASVRPNPLPVRKGQVQRPEQIETSGENRVHLTNRSRNV